MSDSKGAAIDEVLQTFALDWHQLMLKSEKNPPQPFEKLQVKAKEAILALLAQEVKRVIGEDEPLMGDVTGNNFFTADQDDLIKDRNQLRAEQRRKAGLV